jgi:alanyl-tRNA synthetase
LTDEQKREVERIVNQKIAEALPVSFTVMPIVEAEKTGAIHAFGEKYGDMVKIYSIGPLSNELANNIDYGDADQEHRVALEVKGLMPRSEVYSREFCGGPHVQNTGLIKGIFKIAKDEKIARDVVRIKAVLE